MPDDRSPSESNKLKQGEVLLKGDSLKSLNGRFRFTLQDDDNIVLYDRDQPLWSSASSSTKKDQLKLRIKPNGVLELREADGDDRGDDDYDEDDWNPWVRWTSERRSVREDGDAVFVLQDDGNGVVTYNGQAAWATGTNQGGGTHQGGGSDHEDSDHEDEDLRPPGWGSEGDRLKTGAQLWKGLSLSSPNGRFWFTLKEGNDGKAVLEDRQLKKDLWSSDNWDKPKYIQMQGDANLVMHGDPDSDVIWDSKSHQYGDGACEFVIQDNGDAVIFYDGKAVWSTRTWLRDPVKQIDSLNVGDVMYKGDTMLSPNKRYILRLQEDRNLVLYDQQDNNRAVWSTRTSRDGRDNFKLILNNEGNLELYDNDDRTWQSNTDRKGDGSSVLKVHDLGFLCLHSQNRIYWKSADLRSGIGMNTSITRNDTLYSQNLEYLLKLSDTGITITTATGQARWSQSGVGLSDCQKLTFIDAIPARLEIKNSQDQVIWTGRTKKAEAPKRGGEGTSFSLEDDGNAYLWSEYERLWTTSERESNYNPPPIGNRIIGGQYLFAGDSLVSRNGANKCTYQEDGNLVVTGSGGQVLWSSNTRTAPGRVSQQKDGNLIITNKYGQIVSSTRGGFPEGYGAETTMQDDGVLLSTIGGRPFWSSKGVELIIGGDGLPLVREVPGPLEPGS